jgi:hypothetical protein
MFQRVGIPAVVFSVMTTSHAVDDEETFELVHKTVLRPAITAFQFLHQSFRNSLCATNAGRVTPPLWSSGPEVRVRFPTLPHFLRSSGSGMGSTQPREYN